MANFATHIGIGTVVSGALATVTVATGLVAPENIVAATLAGIVGSVLPDIDLEESRPSRAMFSALAVVFAFAVLFAYAARYSIVELLLLLSGAFLLVRYGLHALFHSTAVHRGIWHSLLAAVFAAIATAILFVAVLGRTENAAWLAASFLFVGFITHLVLDEVFSVDLLDRRIKASFGTAFKLLDRKHPIHSWAMIGAVAVAVFAAPSPATFFDNFTAPSLWTGLEQRLLPNDKWFGFLGPASDLARQPEAGADLTTGSIPAVEQSNP